MADTSQTELLEMHLDYDGGNTLHEAIRWSKFLSIVIISGAGLVLVALLIATPFMIQSYGQLTPDSESIVGLALAGLSVYLAATIAAAIVLLRFSRLTRKGMDLQDQPVFNRGLKSLKITFMILGILSCLSLAGLLLTLFFQ